MTGATLSKPILLVNAGIPERASPSPLTPIESGVAIARVDAERFWRRVDQTSECWPWRGAIQSDGYGQYTFRKQRQRIVAHRMAFLLNGGVIPEGMILDHLCRNRICCNPSHLEAVTIAENNRRGLRGVLLTHCPQGHLYDEENTNRWRGTRRCRTCKNTASREYQRRKTRAA